MSITGNLTTGLNQGVMADQNISATQKILQQDSKEVMADAQTADVNQDAILQDTAEGSQANAETAKAAKVGAKMAADKKEKTENKERVNKAAAHAEKSGQVKGQKSSPELEGKAKDFSAGTAGELPSSTLTALHDSISDRESSKNIIDLVENRIKKDRKRDLPERHLVREALKFLIDNADGERKKTLQKAHDEYYGEHKDEIDHHDTISRYAREITVDKNGNIASIRNQIGYMMKEEVSPHEIHDNFHKAYGVSSKVYGKIKVYLNYLGDETKQKGIEPANLLAVNTCVRKLQAVKGVYDRENTNYAMIQKEASGIPDAATAA